MIDLIKRYWKWAAVAAFVAVFIYAACNYEPTEAEAGVTQGDYYECRDIAVAHADRVHNVTYTDTNGNGQIDRRERNAARPDAWVGTYRTRLIQCLMDRRD